MSTKPAESRLGKRLVAYLPVLAWLPGYDRSKLRLDVVAGVTVAASVIPEGLAYASLANLPPQTGLYAGLLGVSAYFLFGTSRQLIVGPTSALAILTASSLLAVTAVTGSSYASLVALTTILVGIAAVVAWALRLGFLVHFVSDSVLTGFSAGAALYIVSTQLGKLFGISGASGNFFERVWFTAAHLGETSAATLLVGLVGIGLLLAGERVVPRAPNALVVVALSILLSSVTNLESRGVDVVGAIPSGLPTLALPSAPTVATLTAVVPVALALFLLSYVQGIGVVETFAHRHDYRADANQELLADGVANLAAGVGGGFAVGGSMSRSALNDAVGGRTQLTNAVVAAVLVVVLVFLTGVFSTLPEAILAAVVIVAVTSLIDAAALRQLYRVSRAEFAIALATLLSVLVFGMLWGVFVGVTVSLLVAISRVSTPRTHELGRLSADYFVAIDLFPGATTEPDVFVYRVESQLFYANASEVRRDLLDRLAARETPVELVVFDLTSSPTVDYAAAMTLDELRETLDSRGVALRFAGTESDVRSMFEILGIASNVGGVNDEESIAAVISRWRQSEKATSE